MALFYSHHAILILLIALLKRAFMFSHLTISRDLMFSSAYLDLMPTYHQTRRKLEKLHKLWAGYLSHLIR